MLLYGEKLNVVDADEFCTAGSIEYTGLCEFPDSEVNRTSSVAGIIYRSPMSEGRECWFGYSCLEELSGSMSDPTIQEGEWPEQAASWMLPDCEHIK
jgi:hypothetical protein